MLDGAFPDESPAAEEDGIRLYADGTLAGAGGVRDWLAAHLRRRQKGEYFAALAYRHPTDATHRDLQAIRLAVRNRRRLATTLGYGPRYLHSTGQYHKGGPNTGLFLMVTAGDGGGPAGPGGAVRVGDGRRGGGAADPGRVVRLFAAEAGAGGGRFPRAGAARAADRARSSLRRRWGGVAAVGRA